MKRFLRLGISALAFAAPCAGAAQAPGPTADTIAPLPADPAIAAALRTISPDTIRADIARLVSFGTRNTLSSMDTDLPPGQGINAAADWIESEFRGISAACGGCLDVKRDEFIEQPPPAGGRPSRIPRPTKLVNIYAILHGTSTDKSAPWTLVTGHYDSRATDVMDSHVAAPGANDDGSGVAVSIESARALSKLKIPGTIVFVTVAGEEQGLNGSHHLAALAKAEGWPLVAVLNNDIVGGDTTPGETQQRKDVVRIFSESIPATATPEQERMMLAIGAENDSPSRELARQIVELAPAYFRTPTKHAPSVTQSRRHSHTVPLLPRFQPIMILRHDRYLRGGDHSSFNGQGFAAVRFTEWRENFNHQHQTVRTENGIEYGDLLKFVDTSYVANVARLNALTLANLAAAPSEPQRVRILTRRLDNNTDLAWDSSAFAPPGTTYEVVWRDTTDQLWTHSRNVGAETHVTLDVSKDNVFFGVRAVDSAGHRSLPVAPVPSRE
ncbi:MAG TPA: M20/M25/M40 family metallo-hydrolase [Candidatus Aquilonibacter sp.]|nr:M20/M25/M40 family metallo-hydrolase [Candidatus Aquilonibacter sp.]